MPLGKIQAVTLQVAGHELAADTLATDTVLQLTGIEDFNEDGGSVSIDGGAARAYTTVTETVDYSVDSEGVDSPNTYSMTLSAQVGSVLPAGTRVDLVPRSEEKVAHVLITGAEDDPVTCILPHEIAILLEDGVREPGTEESVEVGPGSDGGMYVRRLLGSKLQVLSEALDRVPPVTPDGEVPAQVVGVTAQGGVRSVFLTWPAVGNHDLVTYRVHASTVTGFTPDANTLVGTGVAGASFTARQAWNPTLASLVELAPATAYYFRVMAEDVDGVGAASSEIAAWPIQINTPDLVANAVTADQLLANAVTADKLAASMALISILNVGSNIVISPTEGIKISLANGGLIHFPADGSDAVVQAVIRALSITIDDHLTLNGTVNKVQGGLSLVNGTTAPTVKPRVSKDWTNPTTFLSFAPTWWFGVIFGGLWDNGTEWLYPWNAFGGCNISNIQKSNGALGVTSPGDLFTANTNAHGIAKVGTTWYVLVYRNAAPLGWLIYKYDASWVQIGSPVSVTTSAADKCALGSDGTSIFTVKRSGSGMVIQRRNATTLAIEATVTCTGGDWSNYDPTGVIYDSGAVTDVGVPCYIVSANNYILSPVQSRIFVFGTGGARQTSYEWSTAGGETIQGIAWDGTRFHQLSGDSKRVWRFSRIAAANTSRSFTYTRYDSDATGGTHETQASPAQTFTVARRTWTTVEMDPPGDGGGSDDPDSVRVYIDNHRQPDLGAGVTSAIYDTFDLAGAAAPTSNGFSGVSAPGQLTSDASDGDGALVQLKGDGSWRLGNLYSNHPIARAQVNGDIPTGAATVTTLAIAGTPTVSGGMTYTSTALVVPKSGVYRVSIAGAFATNGTGTVRMLAAQRVSGGTPSGYSLIGDAGSPTAGTSGYGHPMGASGLWYLAASDGVYVLARQDSGGTLNVNANLSLEFVHA